MTTGLFFSPNHLGIYLSVGLLCTFFLWQETTHLWSKIGLGLGGLLIFSGLCISESRGAFISLFVALGYYFCSSFRLFRRDKGEIKTKSLLNWKVFIGIAVILASSLYFLSTVNKSKSESTSGRWFATQQILEQITNTPFGHGVGSFSKEYNKAKAVYFEKNTNWDEMKNAGYIYNANNDLLELTFELGIVWMAIFIAFILLLFWKNQDNPEIRFCRSLLVCLLVFSLTTSIIVLPVLVIIGCSCAVVIINRSQSKVIYEFKNRTIYNWIGIGFMLSFLFIMFNRIQAESKLYKLYEGKLYLKGVSHLQGYLSKIDAKGEECFMGGFALIKNGYIEDGISNMQIGFNRSGRPSLGRILADGLQKQKKYKKAQEIYNYNKNVEPFRYEARMDLLDLFIETKQKDKATKMAQEIVHLPVKIPSATIVSFKKKAQSYFDGVEKK